MSGNNQGTEASISPGVVSESSNVDIKEKPVGTTSVETTSVSPVVEGAVSKTVITAVPIFLDPVVTK